MGNKLPSTVPDGMSPDNLIRRYVIVSLVSIVAVLAFTCYGIYRVSFAFVIDNAEDSAVSLGSALTHHVIDRMRADSDSDPSLRVTPANFSQIDASMRNDLEHFRILKIKLYDPKSRIVYSTDRQLIGQTDRDNRRLANALAGNNDSEAVKKDKILDFSGKERFSVDVVETYVPVRDSRGQVVGSFELYQDITHYYQEIIPFVTVAGGLMFMVLSSGFLISHRILKREAAQLKAAQEILRERATTDFLTGLCNRRHLLDRCEAEMTRQKRLRESGKAPSGLGFIMIDIDHFKRINDTYGHAAGDEVLRALAARLSGCLRSYDIVGRYGGEEFLVVVSQTDATYLASVAERLWQTVRVTPFTYDGTEIAVTISLGVASSDHCEEGHEEVIKKADSALYRAKENGRDRICYASPKETDHG